MRKFTDGMHLITVKIGSNDQSALELGFPGGSVVKNPPEMQEVQQARVQSLGEEDPLVEGMATNSSILAWRILLMEEPGGLQSMGSQRVGHD